MEFRAQMAGSFDICGASTAARDGIAVGDSEEGRAANEVAYVGGHLINFVQEFEILGCCSAFRGGFQK